MPATPIILSFSSGLLTPYVATRVDLEKYYSGCRIMNNMIALPYGPAMRTPGTEFIAAEKTESKKVKLFPFKYSTDQSYILEFGHQYIRFYMDGAQIMYTTLTIDGTPAPSDWSADATITGDSSGATCIIVSGSAGTYLVKHLVGTFTDGEILSDGTNSHDCGAGYPTITASTTPCEVSTVYTENDLFNLHVLGLNDILDIVHTDHTIKPYRLSRLAHDDWTITAKDFTYGPFLDENKTDTTLYCSAVTGTGKTLTASAALFDDPNHSGSIWQLVQKTAESRVKGTFADVGNSSTIRCSGGWTFTTEGDWIGDVELQRSYDKGSTWYPYHQFTRATASGLNYNTNGREDEEDVYYRVSMTARTSGSCYYCFSVNDNTVKGVVKITGITSPTVATVDILIDLANSGSGSATKKWNEGAWSDKRGYPGSICSYQQRSAFGGSTYKPQLVWTSRTNDLENMRIGDLATHALIYDLTSGNQDFIRWLIGETAILIGTQGAEHKLGPSVEGQALSPTNINAPIQSTYGSCNLQPVIANDVILYWDKRRRGLMELIYSWEANRHVSRDLTLYAENISESGIVDMAYQQQPFPLVWCVRTDGKLIGFTYKRLHKVEGWHIHPMAGDVESVAVKPGSTLTDEDEVWISVKRIINTVPHRYIERFKPHNWGTDQKDCFFVRSGLTFDGGDPYDVSGASKATPCVITCTAHPFENGQQVKFADIGGMTELNGKVFTVASKATDSFALKDKDNQININSTGFTTYTSGGTVQRVENVMTNLGHLEGETVSVLADGCPLPNCLVSGTQTTISQYANKVHIGLPYVSELMPMDVEIPLRSGTSLSTVKRVAGATLYFHKSLGCKFGSSDSNCKQISFMQFSDIMGDPTPLYSGKKEVGFRGGYDSFANLYVRQELPLPVTVSAIIPEIENLGA